MNESSIIIRNIFYMLSYAFRVLRQGNYADILTKDFEHIEDLLAAILSRGIAMQLKRGLHRTYVEQHDQLHSVRGKLNPYETQKLRVMKQQKADCSFDELSVDNLMNQILRSAATALMKSSKVSLCYKKELRRLMLYFEPVSEIDLGNVQWSRLQYYRNKKNYEMLMNICQMIWQKLLPSTHAGNVKFSLFEEDSMPRLYERFILEYYRYHYPELHANDDRIAWDIPEDTAPGMVQLLPGMHSDITLKYHGQILIIDAKYYQRSLVQFMGKQMMHSANLYQIYTYVKNMDKSLLGNVSGMLLYAKTTEDTLPVLEVPVGGNIISASTLDLNSDFYLIASTLDRIVQKTFGDKIKRIA